MSLLPWTEPEHHLAVSGRTTEPGLGRQLQPHPQRGQGNTPNPISLDLWSVSLKAFNDLRVKSYSLFSISMKYKVVISENLYSIKLSPVSPFSKPGSICAKILDKSQIDQGFKFFLTFIGMKILLTWYSNCLGVHCRFCIWRMVTRCFCLTTSSLSLRQTTSATHHQLLSPDL